MLLRIFTARDAQQTRDAIYQFDKHRASTFRLIQLNMKRCYATGLLFRKNRVRGDQCAADGSYGPCSVYNITTFFSSLDTACGLTKD